MKRTTFYHVLIILFALACAQQARAQRSIDLINDQDRVLLDSAVNLMDNGKAKDAIKIFDKLRKNYKDNYIIEYERLYAFYLAGDYKRIVKEGPKLYDNPGIEPQCYQLVGNAQDVLGDAEAAMKTYDEGLKLFPNSGYLYLEKGNIHLMHKRYNEAAECYIRGVEVQPDFASNYYRLARLYAGTTEPLWAIIYGEVVCNLVPGTERCAEMGKLIYDLFNENVKVEGEDTIHVTMTKDNVIHMTSDSSIVRVPFPMVYEMGIIASPVILEVAKTKKLSVAQIAELRQDALAHIDTVTPGYFNLSLLDFHRKLIKSGHWMAYNMWLMSPGDTEETNQWSESEEGERQIQEFATWFVQNRFVPTVDEPTVMTKVFKTDELDIPSVDEIATAEGCRAHRDDALRLAKWYLEQPVNMQDMAQSKVRQFLMVWMTNTDDFSFTVGDNAAMGHVELFAAFMAAMTEHAIEFKVNKTDEAMYCEVMLQVIDYYKRNKEVLGTVESMEKYLTMDGPTLRQVLAEECRDYKF